MNWRTKPLQSQNCPSAETRAPDERHDSQKKKLSFDYTRRPIADRPDAHGDDPGMGSDYAFQATNSISTCASFGSALTATKERAGGFSPKYLE